MGKRGIDKSAVQGIGEVFSVEVHDVSCLLSEGKCGRARTGAGLGCGGCWLDV